MAQGDGHDFMHMIENLSIQGFSEKDRGHILNIKYW